MTTWSVSCTNELNIGFPTFRYPLLWHHDSYDLHSPYLSLVLQRYVRSGLHDAGYGPVSTNFKHLASSDHLHPYTSTAVWVCLFSIASSPAWEQCPAAISLTDFTNSLRLPMALYKLHRRHSYNTSTSGRSYMSQKPLNIFNLKCLSVPHPYLLVLMLMLS